MTEPYARANDMLADRKLRLTLLREKDCSRPSRNLHLFEISPHLCPEA